MGLALVRADGSHEMIPGETPPGMAVAVVADPARFLDAYRHRLEVAQVFTAPHPATSRIASDPVRILMSGANDHSALLDAVKLGAATRLLAKPVPPDTLRKPLRKLLREALQSRKRPARVLPMAV